MRAEARRGGLPAWGWGLVLLLLAGLAFLPLLGTGYQIRFITLLFMWIGLAGCWNLMTGSTGYIDFGPVAYYGLGAYATAILMLKAGLHLIPAVLLGGCFSMLIAVPIAIPTLRLRGAYFAIATLALAEATKQIVLEWDKVTGIELTGGSHGLTLPLGSGNTLFYYLMGAASFCVMGVAYWLRRSKTGYGLRAIREAEDAARASGVDALKLKTFAYGISAFFLGLLGGITGNWLSYISPEDVFDINITIQMVVMALLGGLGTFLGPIVGATFLTIVSEILWARFVYTYLIIIGVIIVVLIIFMPQGIVGLFRRERGDAKPVPGAGEGAGAVHGA
ncbi:MAG: branched-chain amino acid ABC transporter permease [Nitrospinota bacterium]